MDAYELTHSLSRVTREASPAPPATGTPSWTCNCSTHARMQSRPLTFSRMCARREAKGNGRSVLGLATIFRLTASCVMLKGAVSSHRKDMQLFQAHACRTPYILTLSRTVGCIRTSRMHTARGGGGEYLLLDTIIRTSVVNCMAPTPAVSWCAGVFMSTAVRF